MERFDWQEECCRIEASGYCTYCQSIRPHTGGSEFRGVQKMATLTSDLKMATPTSNQNSATSSSVDLDNQLVANKRRR